MITINNDAVLEVEEHISLVLQPESNTAAPFIAVLPQQTIISIQDNDGINAFLHAVAFTCF